MAAISNTPGAGGAGSAPSAGEMQDYSSKVNNMDTKSLMGELGKNLEPWQRDAAIGALMNKLEGTQESKGSEGAGGAGGAEGAGGAGGEEEDELKKLIKKLMEGSISPEELQKLSALTNIKPEALQAMFGQGGGGGDNSDIQGG